MHKATIDGNPNAQITQNIFPTIKTVSTYQITFLNPKEKINK